MKAIKTLELTKVLERLAGYASFSASINLVRAIKPETDLKWVQRRLDETTEARRLLEVSPDVGIGGARDVRTVAERAVRGITLLPQDLLDVRNTMDAARKLKKRILRGDQNYPLLGELAVGLAELPDLINAIDQTLDDQGMVLDSASPRLSQLRREIRVIRDRIQDKLQHIIGSRASQYLQEPIVSQRGGRWVIPLQSNFKGRIKGIVHDQSSSGATLWIEPMATVDLNNQYREILLAEEQEVQRILAELSALVADHAEKINWTLESLAALDLSFAKAKYAEVIDAVAPKMAPFSPSKGLAPGSTIRLIKARHPLLDPATVVPIDAELDEETYIVIITGPNTGGKTVSLKTVGLLALMAQSGLHVPCIDATLSVFESIFADIGDEQSIEQSLSTFSGHMVNLVEILDKANEKSLVILDELGAGTDPSEGSALARSILSYLRDKGATTFVATHYPELKLYAHNTPGVINASVEFDLETLAPTFRLRVGLAGRSNAFQIAARLGLDRDIIESARKLISDTEVRAEDLLDSIHRARDGAEAELRSAQNVRIEAESERDELKERLKQVDLERLRILQDARIAAQADVQVFLEEIRELRKQLNAAGKPLVEIRQLEQEARALENKAAPKIAPIQAVKENDRESKAIQVGDSVWLNTLRVEGEVLSFDGEEAEVQIGRLRIRANAGEMEWRKRSKPTTRPERESPRSIEKIMSVGHLELDLRGERVESALQQLDTFLDNALLGSVPWVRIIHGKGTGALRTAVRQALKEHPHVKRFDDGKDGEGGWGVTVAHFD
ncbi:MAG: endonuclease MutS2 [Anaerolineales bacterium]|nr:endonuclease MutS2 [Anaerolineales bacterium]